MGFDAAPKPAPHPGTKVSPPAEKQYGSVPNVAFVAPAAAAAATEQKQAAAGNGKGQMLFTGPVFIGYSAEDAAKILRDSGLGGSGR